MLELPTTELADVKSLADWAELNALISSAGVFSGNEAADVLHDAGMWGLLPEDVFRGDFSLNDEDTFSPDEDVYRLSEIVWSELKQRATALVDKYPFQVEGDTLRCTVGSPVDAAGFAMLLLCDITRKYVSVDVGLEPNSESSRLFEKVVEAAMSGLFGGAICRFGWPKEPEWPTPIKDRIRYMADLVGLQTEDLEGKTTPTDKDRGLDVLAGLYLGDRDPSSVFFLAQCATGKNWKEKKGEPSLTSWRDILKWNAQLVRVVAIPWRLDEKFNRKRAFRHFDGAVILDRERLLFGAPDQRLEESSRGQIWTWCLGCVASIPLLK